MAQRVKGGTKIIRGQINTGTYSGTENRIQLFDGKFTTGYRVVDFRINGVSAVGNNELGAMISTEPISTLGQWDFGDVRQIAWVAKNAPTASRDTEWKLITDDNMLLEDLYLQAYTPGEAMLMNYYIVLEKYEFTAWDGAAVLVRNQSQAGPSS